MSPTELTSSESLTAARRTNVGQERWQFDLKWTRIPSWILSALFHAGLIMVWITLSQAEGCRRDVAVGSGEGFREVGLVVRDSRPSVEQTEHAPSPQSDPSRSQLSEAQPVEQLLADTFAAPPGFAQELPSMSLPILGSGPPTSINNPEGGLLQPLLTGAPPEATGGGTGGSTSLFGISDSGRRFVYVVDRSGSMESHGMMQAAKTELLRSLESLDASQRFLVIFYNTELTIIAPTSGPMQFFQGTDQHRLDARQQIQRITGEGGTDHKGPLFEALKYHPDVIFFLTDAARPGLRTDEIEAITSRNGGAARIHCIEFGTSPAFALEDPSNSFRRLAERNHGRYLYKDVNNFRP